MFADPSPDAEIKLIDFGLSKVESHHFHSILRFYLQVVIHIV